MHRRTPSLAVAVGVLVATGLLTGCDGDGGGDGAGATTTATVLPTAAPTTTSGAVTTTSQVITTVAPTGPMVVQVFFLDQDAFNIGRAPYAVPVEREVDAAAPARGALEALFAGPTPEEAAGGLTFVASGATGIAAIRIGDGTAHVTLAGGCSSGGSTFTVADEIVATLRQFEAVDAVRIYDPAGTTGSDRPGDSIPICLEP